MVAPRQSNVRLWRFVIAAGVAGGVILFLIVRHSEPTHTVRAVAGVLMLALGTADLFIGAAFPDRFPDSASARLQRATRDAVFVLWGASHFMPEDWRVGISLAAAGVLLCSTIGFPKAIFRIRDT